MCIWIERWYICPQPFDAEEPKSPSENKADEHVSEMEIGDVSSSEVPDEDSPEDKTNEDPSKPWASWRSGDLVAQSDLDRFGLGKDTNWKYVRHQIKSKNRCAASTSLFCDLAERETRVMLHDQPCPECTGDNRSIPVHAPYRVEDCGHEDMSAAAVPSPGITEAIDTYWVDLMDHEIACHGLILPEIFERPPYASTSPLNKYQHFFESLACTEDHTHVRAYDGIHVYGESCANVLDPVSHNQLRALRREEANSAWQFEGEDFTRALESLERCHILPNLAKLRASEDKTPQEPVAASIVAPNELFATRNAMQMFRLRLGAAVNTGKVVEDETKRGYTTGSFSCVLTGRAWLADQICILLFADPGLSKGLRIGLTKHVVSLLLPWPNDSFTDPVYGRIEPLARTRHFIAGFDRTYPYYSKKIEMAWSQRMGRLHDFKSHREQVSEEDLTLIQIIRHHISSSRTLTYHEAAAFDSGCPICGDLWTRADTTATAPHLSVISMPCCGKPLHSRCILQTLMASSNTEPSCPMCRGNLQERFGWCEAPIFRLVYTHDDCGEACDCNSGGDCFLSAETVPDHSESRRQRPRLS